MNLRIIVYSGNKETKNSGAPNDNFWKNICSEDDLRSRIFGTFLAEIFEKVSFDPYNFRIARLSARKSEQMKNF